MDHRWDWLSKTSVGLNVLTGLQHVRVQRLALQSLSLQLVTYRPLLPTCPRALSWPQESKEHRCGLQRVRVQRLAFQSASLQFATNRFRPGAGPDERSWPSTLTHKVEGSSLLCCVRPPSKKLKGSYASVSLGHWVPVTFWTASNVHGQSWTQAQRRKPLPRPKARVSVLRLQVASQASRFEAVPKASSEAEASQSDELRVPACSPDLRPQQSAH